MLAIVNGRSIALACASLAQLTVAAPATAQVPAASPIAREIAVPITRTGTGALMMRATIGSQSRDLLFDTGGGVTAISPRLASELGCAPAGRWIGYRMTGDRIEGKVCPDVSITVQGHTVRTDAVVLDISPDGTPLDGMLSLHTFAGMPLTLDLPRERVVLETPGTLASRTRTMQPLRARLATADGGDLAVFVGAEGRNVDLWFLWDSGHRGTTFVAPWAVRELGLDSLSGATDGTLVLGRLGRVAVPVEAKEIVHAGVLSQSVLERATWTVDLANGRMWASRMTPLLMAPAASMAPTPPANEVTGWYDVTLVVGGSPQRAVMNVRREAAQLEGRLRFIGTDRVFELQRVAFNAGRLTFDLPMRQTYPVVITFSVLEGQGTWGDPATRGGAVTAHKR